jgi:hypothetical protein
VVLKDQKVAPKHICTDLTMQKNLHINVASVQILFFNFFLYLEIKKTPE